MKDNRTALSLLSGKWIDRVRKARKLSRIVLDMDSSVSETYGRQEGTAYNGHLGCTCYHPLFCFNQFGDLEGAMLRGGERPQCEGLEDGTRAYHRTLPESRYHFVVSW